MSSNINPTNIDKDYPIAGQDNSSQGFRDNFTNIRSNLETAKTEIEDIQSNAILKSPLTGMTEVNNDMNGVLISNALMHNTSILMHEGNQINGDVDLDITNGDYQLFEVSTDVNFNILSTFLASSKVVGKIIVDLEVSVASSISFDQSLVGFKTLTGYNLATLALDLQPGDYVYEIMVAKTTANGDRFIITEMIVEPT